MAKRSLTPLTDTRVRNLKSQEKAYEVTDPSSPGLRLRVNPTGKRSWFYRFRDPSTGKLTKVSVGTYPGMKLAAARTAWAELAAIRSTGQSPKVAKQAAQEAQAAELAEQTAESDKTNHTIKSLVADYVDAISARKKSWKVDQRTLEREVLPQHGSRPAYDLTRGDVRDTLATIRERGADVMANRTLACIRGMFNWALENDWPTSEAPLVANPCNGVKLTKEAPRQRALNDVELKTMLANLPESGVSAEHVDLIRFTLLTGARIGEACSIERQDLFDSEWRIPASKSKNKQSHVVFLSLQAKDIIDRQLEQGDSQWIWPNEKAASGHVRTDTLGMVLREALPALKVEPFRLHDLRRTMATWLGNQQVDETIHDRILNHVNGGIRRVYNTARYNEPARKWWAAWGQHITGLEADNVVQLSARKKGNE